MSRIAGKKVSVLLIEDNLEFGTLLQTMLEADESLEYRVESRDTLGGGLARLRDGGIDVVLLDLMLPDARGKETFRRVKEQMFGVPVVVMTAMTDRGIGRELVFEGAEDFLPKTGINLDVLTRTVIHALERSDLARRLEARNRELSDALAKLRASQSLLIQSEKMNAMGIMTSGVAHELNNPLMATLNFIEYCIKHTQEGDRRRELLQDSEKEIRRCIGIVEDLLRFSRRGERGGKAAAPVRLNEVFTEVLRLFAHRLKNHGVELVRELQEDLPEVVADAGGLKQVVLNLITNAVDAVKDGDERRVRVGTASRDGRVLLSVADSGGGIAPNAQERIFDPFFTTKPTGQGTGLGLYICQNIVREQGGELSFESAPGKGTVFTVSLPADPSAGGS